MVNITMLNPTCRMLSAGYKFIANQSSLSVQPCCAFGDQQRINNKHDLANWRTAINSIDSQQDPRCAECNYIDRAEVRKSRREIGFQFVSNDASVGDPSWLEIQTDLTCNGGCVMCGPWFSSYWANELGVQVPASKQDHLAKISTLIDFQKARNILILGGEPMLSDIDERLPDFIDNPSQVSLQLTTNGSIYPSDKKIASWSKFQQVLLNFSIDGVGDRFEYLRYPLKWDRVEKNMLRLQQELPPNVKCKINHVVTSLNLFYYDEFVSWFNKTLMPDDYNRGWMFTVTPAAGVFSPQSVTSELKQLVIDKYTQSGIPTRLIESNSANNKELQQTLAEIDRRRNLNWRTIFPEIAHAL